MARVLTALPVYNEAAHVAPVLDEVLRHAGDVLVVDDGSTDGTAAVLAGRDDVRVVRHAANRGYGAALLTAFRETLAGPWDGLVTIDCDGQHQPRLIPAFAAALAAGDVDIVSGSRYLERFPGSSTPPAARRRINAEITAEVNARLGLRLTDAFCGFKAYSRRALEVLAGLADRGTSLPEQDATTADRGNPRRFHRSAQGKKAREGFFHGQLGSDRACGVVETGYAMPLEAWVVAAAAGLVVEELPVPLVYLDLARSFGGALDDAATRLAYYRRVLDCAEAAVASGAPGDLTGAP